MLNFKYFLNEQDAIYCQGLSINADLWWDSSQDVSFLKMSGKELLINNLFAAVRNSKLKVFDKKLTSYGDNPEFGFSYLIVLGQSHVMVHTWPENSMMNIDIFTCGSEGGPEVILSYLKKTLKPNHVQMKQAKRGVRKDIKSVSEKPDRPSDLKQQRLF